MEIYHAMNRGVEKRDIFLDEKDCARFVRNLYEFNDTQPADNNSWFWNNKYGNSDIRGHYSRGGHSGRDREKIVDIHGWCLMRNHYHLILSERIENGLSLFLRKLNVGYAKYFNERYERSGYVFQGRTKKVHVLRDRHFLYLLHYIHLNPLDLAQEFGSWRKKTLNNVPAALDYLDTWRWSSYLDYSGKRNFPSILDQELYSDTYTDYRNDLISYLKDISHELPESLILE